MHFLVRLSKFHHICHYFPVKRHSFVPNDCDFGCNEIMKSKSEFTPERVVPVSQCMVHGYADHYDFFSRRQLSEEKATGYRMIGGTGILKSSCFRSVAKYGIKNDKSWSGGWKRGAAVYTCIFCLLFRSISHSFF